MARFQVEHADDHNAMEILSCLATAASSLPGCRGCSLIHGDKASAPFVLVEEWDSEERLGRHVASEGFRSVLVHFGIGLRQADEDSPADRIILRFSRLNSPLELESYTKSLTRGNHD